MSKSLPSPPQAVLQRITLDESNDELRSASVLWLAAHPDDETIGSSALLGRLKNVFVAYLTDGAPRDPRFRSQAVKGSRKEYAAVRAEEAISALGLVGITRDRVRCLSGIDQEAIFEIPKLLEGLLDAMRHVRPSIIVTHPYEGGHPDHDTAALVARRAVDLAEQRGLEAPYLFEMTSYHGCEGRCIAGEFLSTTSVPAEPVATLNLSAAERSNKSRMLACYASQSEVLSGFPLEPERLRVAPTYDFTRPPHGGSLWYECLSWPLTGARWRQEALKALEQYGHLSCH